MAAVGRPGALAIRVDEAEQPLVPRRSCDKYYAYRVAACTTCCFALLAFVASIAISQTLKDTDIAGGLLCGSIALIIPVVICHLKGFPPGVVADDLD
jgi:hypothetical protein